MKFLLDENIPFEAKDVLENADHDVRHIIELKLCGASDEDVLGVAKKEKRILVTFDLGFSNILSYPPKSHPGIVVIRLNLLSRKKIVSVLEQFIKKVGEEEILGALVVLEDTEYRVRR